MMRTVFVGFFLFAIGVEELLVIRKISEVLFAEIAEGVELLVRRLFLLVDGGVLEKEIICLGEELVLLLLVDV